METDTASRGNLLPSNFDSREGGVGYSLCNTQWSPEPVPCTVESTRFPLHDSLLTVRQTDIQSLLWMIMLLLNTTLWFMCNFCERIHTPFWGRKRSQAPGSFFFLCQVHNRTFSKLAVIILLSGCLDKKLWKTNRSGIGSKRQVYWIIWITSLG